MRFGKKAELKPHYVIIATLVFTVIITLGMSFLTNSLSGTGTSTPEALNGTLSGLSPLNTSANQLVAELEAQTNQTSWLSAACRTFAGDNFFCAGLDALDSLKSAPGTYRAMIEYTSNSAGLPFVIPAEVVAAIISILVIFIVFMIIYQVRRYK